MRVTGYDAEAAGTTSGDVLEVNAWRGSALLASSLDVTGWSLGWDATRQVQGQGSFTIPDPEGRLAPWSLSDPLAPGGSRLQVTWVSGLTGLRIPLGWWRIRKATPTESWRLVPTSTPTATVQPVAHTNLATNPDAEAYGAVVTLRTNWVLNPAMGTDTTGWSPGGAGTGGTSTASRVAGAGHAGGYAYVKTWSVAPTALANTTVDFGGTGADPLTNAALTASTLYTMSVWFWAPAAGTYNLVTVERTGAGVNTNIGQWPHVCVAGWNLLKATATSSATTALVRGSISQTAGPLVTTASQWRLSEPLVERVGTALPYFDGATPAAGDFTYAWTGTAHASASTQRAPAVAGVTALNGTVGPQWSSVTEHAGRTRSWACMPLGATYTGFIGAAPGVLAGHQVTAKVMVKAPTGLPVRLGVRTSTGGGVSNVDVMGTGAWQEVTTTAQAATNGALVGVQITNAPPFQVGVPFYVDRLMIVTEPTTYTGPYFDGRTPDTAETIYNWTGAADASTSTLSPKAVTYASSVLRLPGGGYVDVAADEETATVVLSRLDAEVVTAPTVLAEVTRLLRDICAVKVLAGVVDGNTPRGLVYGDSRMDAVEDLLAVIGASHRMAGDGSLEVVPAAGVGPVWTLAGGDAGVLIELSRALSDESIYNGVTSTNETPEGQPLVGRAFITSGPLAWGGPFGKVPLFHKAAATTANGVQADADTLLAGRQKSGEVDLAVTCLAHPGVQPQDRVTLLAATVAGEAPVTGRVVGMTLSSAGSASGTTPAKAMGLTVRVSTNDLEMVAARVRRG